MRTAPFVAVLGGFLACIVSVFVFSDRLASRDAELARERAWRASVEQDLRAARAAEILALARLEKSQRDVERVVGEAAAATKAARDAERVRDAVQAELLAAQDRLEKAYKDIMEMESQIIVAAKEKNELLRQLGQTEPRHGIPPHWMPRRPTIEGLVLGVSDKVNLVLISVGKTRDVEVGQTFTVYRDRAPIANIIVDRVDDTWAACRVAEEFKRAEIRQGDQVSTR